MRFYDRGNVMIHPLSKKIFLLSVVIGVVLFSQAVMAQGFKKLDVNTKFGTQDTTPLQVKSQDTTQQTTQPAVEGALPEGMTYLNGTDVDIREMIRQISALTKKNFIIDDKVKGKITIVSDTPMTREMAYEAFLSALEINGFTTVMTPAGLINIIPQENALQKPIELYEEDSPITDRYITRIVQLANISANEISTIISPMISKKGKATAYPITNSLIITDTGSNIDHVLQLVKELDQEGPQEVLTIIPIQYADAKDIADKISQIYPSEDASKSSSAASRVRRTTKTGGEMEDVQAISKVLADERTNSILIMGTKRSIVKIRSLIATLDRPVGGADGTIHVYYLKYAKAKDVASVLSSVVSEAKKETDTKSGKTTSKTSAKDASSSGVILEGGVQVTADETNNALVIVSSAKDFTNLIDNVVSKLDLKRAQVYLEVVIMSLDVTKSQTLGISGMAGLASSIAGQGYSGFASIFPLAPVSISTVAGASGGFAAGATSDATIPVTTVDLSTGTTTSTDIPAVSSIIQALATDTDANVLSTPSIMTLDNEEAKIVVGQNIPVPSGQSQSSSGLSTFDVEREDVGIELTVTPQISGDDIVRLNIEQNVDSVISTDPNWGATLDTKSVTTVVLAKNKQTIVIGGLIDDQMTMTTQKVPFLGDIPVLGNLFKTKVTQKDKTNLVVFITPYIIRERKDYMAVLKKKLEERNKFIDMNYGTSQRKQIRKAIQNHAADLLEFRCVVASDEDPCLAAPTQTYSNAADTNATTSATSITSSSSETQNYDPPRKTRYKQ